MDFFRLIFFRLMGHTPESLPESLPEPVRTSARLTGRGGMRLWEGRRESGGKKGRGRNGLVVVGALLLDLAVQERDVDDKSEKGIDTLQ